MLRAPRLVVLADGMQPGRTWTGVDGGGNWRWCGVEGLAGGGRTGDGLVEGREVEERLGVVEERVADERGEAAREGEPGGRERGS